MPRTFSIRAHLLLLAAVSALPMLAFGAMLLVRLQDAQLAAFGRDVVSVTRALSLAIDNRIAVEQSVLEALARSRALQEGRLQAFHAELTETAKLLGGSMALSDPSGAYLMTSLRPYGTPLPPRNALPWTLEAVREQRPVLSDVYRGVTSDSLVVSLEVPIVRDGAVQHVLSASVSLQAIDALIRAQRLPARWLGAVVDRQGRYVQRTLDNERTLGELIPERFRQFLQSAPDGWGPSVSLEGIATYAGFTRSERTGWSVAIGVPAELVSAPFRRGLWRLLAIGALLAAVGAGAALWLARRIARPVTALAAGPEARLAAPSGITEVQALARALRQGDADREAAQAALRDSEAELRAATDLSPQRPWTAGPDGRLLSNSRRVADVAGVAPSALLGDGWLSVVHPDDQAGAIAAWAHSVRTGALYSTEFRVREKDGSYVWTHARATPRLGPDGQVIRWYGTTEPIQARKQAEQALQASRAELQALANTLEARVEAEVAAREAALARLAQSQRMQALGQLASGIAHDFNNVLQAVSGGLSLIRKRADDPATVARLASMSADAAARGAAITGRLLSLSRKGELRAGPVDAATLLADLAEVLTHTLGAGVAVKVDAPPDLPPLVADRGQLETVLINLATNARDAMAGGTLTFSARVHEVQEGSDEAEAGGLAPGRFVRIAAQDTGAGMPPDVLARAREPFFTTKEVGRGTGLGLSMAHGFAEQSGGRMDIASFPGVGTTVSLLLPCAAEAPAPAVPTTPALPPVAQARLLVVDDDPIVRGVMAAQLADLGYAVTEAPDGTAALAVLDGPEGGDVALLVSDLTMPGMDGVALIRAAQARRRLPAILLTGYVGDGAALAVGGAVNGSFSLVQKPVSATALSDRIAALLGGKNIL